MIKGASCQCRGSDILGFKNNRSRFCVIDSWPVLELLHPGDQVGWNAWFSRCIVRATNPLWSQNISTHCYKLFAFWIQFQLPREELVDIGFDNDLREDGCFHALLKCGILLTLYGQLLKQLCSQLQWHYNVLCYYRQIDCLLNRLIRQTAKKISKPALLALCEENPPTSSGFLSQSTTDMEIVSM